MLPTLPGSTGEKLLYTGALIVLFVIVRALTHWLARAAGQTGTGKQPGRVRFWIQQVASLLLTALLVIGLVAIWFESAARLGTVVGWVSAGVAVALQRVITAFAAYLIILRGRLFTVGDRIVIGGVRGDVVALGYMQTTVLEMGETPGEQGNPPSQWVQARQYTGRLVRVTNDKIFDAPVYNYTREFPFIWEELHIPVKYGDDHGRVEQILLEAARRHTASVVEQARPAMDALRHRYFVPGSTDIEPRVYLHLTDNWIALSLRFVAPERGVRVLKDAMSRDILQGLDAAGIGIASGTYEIVGVPPLQVKVTSQG